MSVTELIALLSQCQGESAIKLAVGVRIGEPDPKGITGRWDHFPCCRAQGDWDPAVDAEGSPLETICYWQTNECFLIHHAAMVYMHRTRANSTNGTRAQFCPHCGVSLDVTHGGLVDSLVGVETFDETFDETLARL